MNRICLFASEVAIITGHNKYEKIDKVTHRLLAEYFPKKYNTLVKQMKNEGVEIIPADKTEHLKKIIKDSNISGESKKLIEQTLKKTVDSKNSKEFLENQNNLIKKIQDEIVKKQGKPLSKEVKQTVKETVKGSTNTNYGIKNENKGTSEYTKITGNQVYSYDKFVKMPLFADTDLGLSVILGGRVDGVLMDNDGNITKVVEVKNRTARLFYTLRDYEKVQTMIYMKLFNQENLDLIEILRKKDDTLESNIINIDFDHEFWDQQIYNKIKIYIADFLKTYILD
jgi:hypothetical protein